MQYAMLGVVYWFVGSSIFFFPILQSLHLERFFLLLARRRSIAAATSTIKEFQFRDHGIVNSFRISSWSYICTRSWNETAALTWEWEGYTHMGMRQLHSHGNETATLTWEWDSSCVLHVHRGSGNETKKLSFTKGSGNETFNVGMRPLLHL